MTAYLANGWFTSVGPRRLRAEVVDGAIDAAAALHQAEVPLALLTSLVMRLRTMALLLGRSRSAVSLAPGAAALPDRVANEFGHAERQALRSHLVEATDADFTLQAFVTDCLDHVGDTRGLQAMYLHMLHVVHLVRLLTAAKRQASTLGVAPDLFAPTNRIQPQAAVSWHAPR